jgi:hypothetical protein
MLNRRLGDTVDGWAQTAGSLGVAFFLAAVGCAHHRADQYAYAPPYAPPVYPQPQVQMPVQPANSMVGGAVTPGTIVPTVGGECPPCVEGGQGVVVSSGVMPLTATEGGGQTPPCPPGP